MKQKFRELTDYINIITIKVIGYAMGILFVASALLSLCWLFVFVAKGLLSVIGVM